MAKTDPRVRSMILERYSKAQPAVGIPYDEWCQETSKETGLSVKQINNIVVRQAMDFRFELDQKKMTVAQQIAHRLGATEQVLINKVLEALEATQEDLIYFEEIRDFEGYSGERRDGSGQTLPNKVPVRLRNPQKDENGNWVTHKRADYRTRVGAIRELVGILGAKMPEHLMLEVQHQHNITLTNLSDDELQSELNQIRTRRQLLSGAEATSPERTGTRRGTPGPQVLDGHVRVVDGGDKDSRRAGRNLKSNETVPDAPLHPPVSGQS